VLAASPEAMNPSDVQTVLGGDLAYTTVMTALSRLYDKGAVTRQRRGRAFVYRWAADRSTVTARQMRRLLDRDVDREAVLAQFVAELGPDDGRLVAALLDAAPQEAE
jgi:predicted transcriptional regulator